MTDMALIIQCLYCTESNGKAEIAKKCLESLVNTVNFKKHRLFQILNNCSPDFVEWYKGWRAERGLDGQMVAFCSENIGTARGINLGLAVRESGEVCIKTDDDVKWFKKGWVEQMEAVMSTHPEIGILGLKRDDIWQRPDHENPAYRTLMVGELEMCGDIMGTCTAFNPAMLYKVGFMTQPGVYGFDDCIFSVRSESAGFKNAFLPSVKIENLDVCDSEYAAWKRKEAGFYLSEVSIYMDKIKKGEISYYYDGD